MSKLKRIRIVKPYIEDEINEDDYVDFDKVVEFFPDGTRKTNEYYEKLAEEIENTPSFIGRPSLSGKQAISPEIKCRVPELMKHDLLQIAKERNQKLSTVIRIALFEYIDRNTELVFEVDKPKSKRSKASA